MEEGSGMEDESNLLALTSFAVDCIQPPSLDFDSNSDDNEDLESLILDPVLNQCCDFTEGTIDNAKFSNNYENANSNPSSRGTLDQGACDLPSSDELHQIQITKLMDHGLAEMELDNTLLLLEPSHTLVMKPVPSDLSSLSDSGSSSSSLLAKLADTMSSIKEMSEKESIAVEKKMMEIQSKDRFAYIEDDKRETVVLDLRHPKEHETDKLDPSYHQIPTNHCVLQRYGRSQCSVINEDDGLVKSREQIKMESELITLQKGKLKEKEMISYEKEDDNKCHENHKTCEEEYIQLWKDSNESVGHNTKYGLKDGRCEKMTSKRPLHHNFAIDSMLENANRIIQNHTNDSAHSKQFDMPEKVESSDTFETKHCDIGDSSDLTSLSTDQVIIDSTCDVNGETVIQKSSSVAKVDKSLNHSDKSSINADVNLEIKMKSVDCSGALDGKINGVNCRSNEVIRENVSDSIFTNSFLSPLKQENCDKSSKAYSKPKSDILGISKKKRNEISNEEKMNKCIHTQEKMSVLSNHKDEKRSLEKASEISSDLSSFGKVENITQDGSKCHSQHVRIYDGDTSYCNGVMEENLSHSKTGDHTKGVAKKTNRQLSFTGNKNIEKTEIKKSDEQESSNHALITMESETPVKNAEAMGVHKKKEVMDGDFTRNTNCKMNKLKGTSASILADVGLIAEQKNNLKVCKKVTFQKDYDHSSESNKENSSDGSPPILLKSSTSSLSPEPLVNTVKNSKKNKKKKKSKSNGKNIEVEMDNDVEKEERKNVNLLLKEVFQGEGIKLLYDEEITFEQGYTSLPDTNKQLLALRIPLESPGVCKTNNADSMSAFANQTGSDNYIGLVTLFTFLLKDSRWDLSTHQLDIPFDVVSLQQAHLDGELLLIVGIIENKNTYQQKTKRTKLGTNFFHAVSQFLNTNYLEKILWQIWEITESENSKIHKSLPFPNIWRQVELKTFERNAIPGSKKLSTFINISPDTNALQRICSLIPSLYVNTEEKNGKNLPEEFNWFQTSKIKQDYTCITVENVTAISPKHVAELLKRLRKESVEICSLRIGYNMKDNTSPILSICINEYKSMTVEEGKLLLSDCEELKELAISFHSQDNVVMNGSPLLKYAINRSHEQVIQWFGPHYKSVEEMKDVRTDLKSMNKLSSKSDKKKWISRTRQSQLSLLTNFLSSAVLLISSLVPSAFIAFIISLALKKGLQLKMIFKTSISASQLGFPDEQGDVFSSAEFDRQKSNGGNRCLLSCLLLLFHGRSTAFRLLGLITKLTEVLNNPLTGETLSPWMVDKMIKFNPSHNSVERDCNLSHLPRDFFAVFHFNDHMKEVLSASFEVPKQYIAEDLYSILSKVHIMHSKPEINLVAFVFYGDEILQDVPTILRIIFSDTSYECINSWRQSCRSRPFSTKHQPSIELLGAKYIMSVTKLQASNLVEHELLSIPWQKEVDALHGNNAMILMLKMIDKRTVSHIKESISKYLFSSKLQLDHSNIIIHTDSEYVFRMMFQFFQLNELHGDILKDESQIAPFCLPDNHTLFTVLGKILDLQLQSQMLVKLKLPDKEWEKILPISDLPTTSHVYQFCPSSLNFPLQLLLRHEKSYTGVSFQYQPHNFKTIAKALGRIIRMGFQLVALKFPCFDVNTGASLLRAVLMREDAVFVLNKMIPELEKNYPAMHFTVTDIVHDVTKFVQNEFKGSSRYGGIFYCNYFALLHELNFEREECFDSRERREVDWHPLDCKSGSRFEASTERASLTESLLSLADEVTVIILSEPLLSGRYLGHPLPSNSVFPELWHILESASYRMIASKTTMLTAEASNEIVEVFKVDDKKKYRMKKLLSQKGGPFITLALVGSCILSNFWLTMERKLDDENAVAVLKQHSLVPTSKKQVEILLSSLFDTVLPNSKVELKMRVS